MFLYLYVNLNEGDLCIVNEAQHAFYRQAVRFKRLEYVMQRPLFVFETADRERVVLTCETHFETIPYKASLRFLIDLALQTQDEEWFRELVVRLHCNSQ